jgi:hypothetical protein
MRDIKLYPYQQAVVDKLLSIEGHIVDIPLSMAPCRMGMTTLRGMTPNFASLRLKEPPKLTWPPRRSLMQRAMQHVFSTWSGK